MAGEEREAHFEFGPGDVRADAVVDVGAEGKDPAEVAFALERGKALLLGLALGHSPIVPRATDEAHSLYDGSGADVAQLVEHFTRNEGVSGSIPLVDLMSSDTRHVLITGTSSGIGKATMEAALSAGFHVFAGDRADDSSPAGPPAREGARSGTVTRLHLDVTSEADIAAATETISGHVGEAGLDGLANIAGIGIPGPLETMPVEQLRRSLEVDFFGQIALTQPLIPLIRKARGRIVFIGSIADRTTVPFFGALAASKSAIAAASDTFRQELAPWGIDVVLVEPGFISTGADETTKAMIDKVREDFTPEAAALYGEMFGKATERGYRTQTSGSSPGGVADVIIEAMTAKSPKARYLTGAKAHLVADMAKLPQKAQDAAKRKAFGLPDPGSLAE